MIASPGSRHENDCPFKLEGCDLGGVRKALEAAGYNYPALEQACTVRDADGRPDIEVLTRRTRSPSPFHTLVRLFGLGETVPLQTASAALAPATVDRLVTVGLLQHEHGGVRSVAAVVPFEDLFMVRDFEPEVTGQPPAANHVLGVGTASITLANLTVRQQQEEVLDLGTGSGIQALLSSRHAARVVATDTNRRALNFADLARRLNAQTHIELLEGSLYEPVEGCAFDLIVSNPPFVISPESRYVFRDGGLGGDVISERVVRDAPRHLRDGGYAVVLCNWHHEREEDWPMRPRAWLADSGCDAWVLHFKTEDALTYAGVWLRATEAQDRHRYQQLLDQWLAYYERQAIRFVSAGAVVLRRNPGRANWVRLDHVPGGRRVGACGQQILRVFAAQDFLARLDDDRSLLEHAFRLAPEHALEQVLKRKDDAWSVERAQLKLAEGLAFSGDIDALTGFLLAGCDGQRPLRQLVDDLGQRLGTGLEQIAAACTTTVRRLLQYGFLSVISAGNGS